MRGLASWTDPKQAHVAAVWNDVVDHVGEPAAAAGAMPVLGAGEEGGAFPLPLAVIAALTGARPLGVGAGPGLGHTAALAITGDTSRDAMAAAADARGFERHVTRPYSDRTRP